MPSTTRAQAKILPVRRDAGPEFLFPFNPSKISRRRAPHYADIVYEGRWWTTEREAYDAFVDVTQQRVTGSVKLRLFKGSAIPIGRESKFALYDERFVTFGEDDVYQQGDAAGFIRLFALPARVRALKDQELAKDATEGAAGAPAAAPVAPAESALQLA